MFQAWSDIGFQYLPCRGRYHKVIGVANQLDAFIASFAVVGGFGASVGPFRVEQPFHPIQSHIRQQGRRDASLRRAGVRRREEAEFDHSCFQPSAQRGGEDWQLGQ